MDIRNTKEVSVGNSVYNIVNEDLSNGLNNVKISAGRDYLILLAAPANANVRVRLNNMMADEIPLAVNYAVKSKDVTDIFVSADVVQDGKIKIGQSDSVDNFEIITAPQVSAINSVGNVESLNNISQILIDKLDKLIHPYNDPVLTMGEINSTSLITTLNKTLTCDKIILNLVSTPHTGGSGSKYNESIWAELDGVTIADSSHHASGQGAYGNHHGLNTIELGDVSGKTLVIKGKCANINVSPQCYALQEFTKKV